MTKTVAAGAVVVGLGVALMMTARTQAPERSAAEDWELVVLGIAQDAGIPHLRCEQPLCESVRQGVRPVQRVSSIGLVSESLARAYLFDATPDFVSQVDSLTGGPPPDGIFLTHGHMGHYTGLMYLGRESIDADGVPVYGTQRMADYLTANGPWSQLVSRNNIDLQVMRPDAPIRLEGGVTVTALEVPHRQEYTDAVGFLIEGPNRSALFIPDIDKWSEWDRDIREMVDRVDIALLDGSFASPDEIPGRSTEDIRHPMIGVTRELLAGSPSEVWFIHLNHTNRQIEADDVARDGQRFGM